MELDMATLTVSPSTKSRGQDGQSRNFRLHDCIGLFRDSRERVRAAKNTHILLFQSVGSHRFSQMICATRPHLSQTWNMCFFMLNSQSFVSFTRVSYSPRHELWRVSRRRRVLEDRGFDSKHAPCLVWFGFTLEPTNFMWICMFHYVHTILQYIFMYVLILYSYVYVITFIYIYIHICIYIYIYIYMHMSQHVSWFQSGVSNIFGPCNLIWPRYSGSHFNPFDTQPSLHVWTILGS